MVKVKYNGSFKACRIKVGSATFNDWKRGEVLDLDNETAELLLLNKDFELVGSKPIKVEKKVEVVEETIEEEVEEVIEEIIEEVKEKVKFDFDGDGDFDADDVSLGAKAMAAARKRK